MKTLCLMLGLVPVLGGLLSASSWERAERNAAEAQKAVRLSKKLVWGWLDQADPKTGLIPRNLKGDWFWNAKDSAADNFPFLFLTAYITGDYHLKQETMNMLRQEERLTNRLDRLPDDFLFSTQTFRPGPPKVDDIIFGAAEYAKDGLLPMTEWLGPGPWLDRMVALFEVIWKRASYETESGKLPSLGIEVNGDLLQVNSRLYWLTRDERFRRWVFRLTDHYFLHEDILKVDSLDLDDHGCEIISGLSEGYLIASKTDPERWKKYKAPMHAILDRILKYGRNADGLLYNKVNPVTGEVLDEELTDNWGYDYNAFLTVAKIDGEQAYREAVEKVLGNIGKYVNYPWEMVDNPWAQGDADGYADSIESGIYLLNRIPMKGGFRWVEESMRILLAKQGPDGIVEGWHGDGNSARTALMYALWKTQGITASPWRLDLQLGASRQQDGSLEIYVMSKYPWHGRLRFDRPRHRDYLHLPWDYPRLNQFVEWFTVEDNTSYQVSWQGAQQGTAPRVLTGQRLRGGYALTLKPNVPVRLTVKTQ